MWEKDITEEAYQVENRTISIGKLEDDLKITVKAKVGVDISNTEQLNSFFNNEKTWNMVLDSQDEILSRILSNAQAFTILANNKQAFEAFCEDGNARTLMYNQYTITESILANSTTAIEVMKNSTRYQVVSVGLNAREEKTLYAGKAFVIAISQNGSSDQSFIGQAETKVCYHHGRYLSGGVKENKSAALMYGNTGLLFNVKKFASSVVGTCYNHLNGGGHGGTGYAAIFKI